MTNISQEKRTIKLYKNKGSWMALDSDPKVKELFGTDCLPTAFTDKADADMVLAEISFLNQDATVIVLARGC